MIAPELVNELQRLNREEKIAVIRLLQNDLDDEPSEWDELVSEPGRVFRIPTVRANFNEARFFLDPQEEKSEEND